MSDELRSTRREIIKKMAFVTPVIMTFPAVASFARAGSSSPKEESQGQGQGAQGEMVPAPWISRTLRASGLRVFGVPGFR